jgi:CobW/HypB/UreG, nucleotide-binding domain
MNCLYKAVNESQGNDSWDLRSLNTLDQSSSFPSSPISSTTSTTINTVSPEYRIMIDQIPKSKDNSLTPITVITGLSGAGKTTLVNFILKKHRDWNICVLVNELGDVSIDDALVAESFVAPEHLISTDNGCANCWQCPVREDLVQILRDIANRRKSK